MSIIKNLRKTIRSAKIFGVSGALKFFLAHYSARETIINTKFGRPMVLRGRTSDLNVAYDIFRKGPFDRVAKEHFDVIIDAGANVGCSTLFFSVRAPQARIIAIEPELANFRQLIQNTRGLSNVTAYNKCLWFRHEVLQLENPGEQSWEFRFSERGVGDAQTASGVESITLKDLLDGLHLDQKILVKMDIEGAEKEIFKHGSDWLGLVDCVMVEIHGCWKQVFDALIPYDYKAEVVGEYILLRFNRAALKT